MSGEAVCWTSCLACLRRFAFPLCAKWHPIYCVDCAPHHPGGNALIGNVAEVADARA